jgi:hypothetical protein
MKNNSINKYVLCKITPWLENLGKKYPEFIKLTYKNLFINNI